MNYSLLSQMSRQRKEDTYSSELERKTSRDEGRRGGAPDVASATMTPQGPRGHGNHFPLLLPLHPQPTHSVSRLAIAFYFHGHINALHDFFLKICFTEY